MEKNISKHIIVLLGSLLWTAAISAQTDVSALLTKKFENYQLHNFQEKSFIQTDKSFYLVGETIWFKIYNVDQFLNKPSSLSSVSYIELIDNNHHGVLQTKVEIENGMGSGSLSLSPNVPSGNYLLRSYTNLMKNFSADFYFEQPITIINTLNKIVSANSTNADSASFDIQFFPEGGNLVNGIESKVAFKIINGKNEGVDASGIIADKDNITVANFSTFKFGMGNFTFIPQKNNYYHTVLRIGDKEITEKLPQAFDEGYVMHVSDSGAASIQVYVHSNITSDNFIYLFVQSHNLIKAVEEKAIQNGEVKFDIDKNKLGDGISQLTIFDPQKHPVCERLYFKIPEKKLLINAATDKLNYQQRKKAVLQISTTDVNGIAVNANLSASVFQLDTLQKLPVLNILNYLLLVSDLKGKVEFPDYYFQSNDKSVKEAADNLMLTQGWRRFDWNVVLRDSIPYFSYLPEMEGLLIKGKIINRTTNLPGANINAYLSVPGESFLFAPAASNSSGDILFNMKKFYGKKEIITQTDNAVDSNYRIDISNAYSDNFSENAPSLFVLNKNLRTYLVEKNIEVQVENSFLVQKKNHYLPNEDIDTLNFYGKPDWQYYLDNYTRFQTMDEVLHEYVLDVHFRKRSDNYLFTVGNDDFKSYFDDAPLVLIDGVPVFDNNSLMSMNPLKIKKLDIVARRFFSGSLISSGIISFGTYEGDLAGFDMDTRAIALEYDGLQSQREFYSPVYNDSVATNTHLPDFRNVLSWMPQIKTDRNRATQLSFYTSDIAGKFAIVIQGLTGEGLCGFKTLSFNVVKE